MTNHNVQVPLIRRHGFLVGALVLLLSCSTASSSSSSSSVLASTSISAPSAVSTVESTENGQNPAFQLVGYVKDSVVRTVDGIGLMWKNHGRCNEIRAKQKNHRECLRLQYENDGLSNQEIKQKLKGINGGITYDEYIFLVKGKEDRGKLTQLVFLSWGAPRFLPYVLMFYPDMLPSAFAPQQQAGMESKLETLSRQRSHAVIRTLLNLEKDAKVVPTLAKLNIFGRKKHQRAMKETERIGQLVGSLFVTPINSLAEGAELMLKSVEESIYRSDTDFETKSKRLVYMPKSIIIGLAQTLEGSSPLDKFLPLFVTRGKVLSHIKKITDSDEFLVSESIAVDKLGRQRLMEACNDRLIGVNGDSIDEMRAGLADWLDQSVVKPVERVEQTGEFYNGNMARSALLCFYATQATKDDRAASYLPRLLFQGPPVGGNRGVKSGTSKKGRIFSPK